MRAPERGARGAWVRATQVLTPLLLIAGVAAYLAGWTLVGLGLLIVGLLAGFAADLVSALANERGEGPPPMVGPETLTGRRALAVSDFVATHGGFRGTVRLAGGTFGGTAGETWSARMRGGGQTSPLRAGEPCRVLARDGLELVVARVEEGEGVTA